MLSAVQQNKRLTTNGSQDGFTLIELAVVLSIAGILATVGIPQLGRMRDTFDRNSARRQIAFDIGRAKAETSSAGARGVIKVSANLKSYVFGIDSLPYNDPVDFDRAVFISALPGDVKFHTEANPLLFSPRGYLVDKTDTLTDGTFSLRQRGEVFCVGNVFPVGTVEYDCDMENQQ